MRGCHPRRSSPPLRPFVCNSGSSFDRRLLHAYDWLYERRCHPSPVGRAFDFIACHSAIATHVATTMSAFAPRPRTQTRQSFRLLCAYTRGSDFYALRAERHTAETTYQCKSESAEFNLRLRYDMRISVIIFSPTENGPRRLRLTLVCSFSIIILDSDSIKTLGRE